MQFCSAASAGESCAPGDGFCRLMRGWALLEAGEHKTAKPEFMAALSLSEGRNFAGEARLGAAMSDFLRGDYREALPQFQRIYGRDPYNIGLASYLAAECFFRQGKYPSALIYIRQSLLHDSQNPSAQRLQAEISEKLGQPVEAYQAYGTLRQFDPGDREIAGEMSSLAKKLKGRPADYMYYTRIKLPLPHGPRSVKSPEVRMAYFAGRGGAAAELSSVEFISASTFTVEGGGMKLILPPVKSWTLSWNPARKAMDIRDNWGETVISGADKVAMRHFPDNPENCLLLKNAVSSRADIDLSDRELRGEILFSAGENGFLSGGSVRLEDLLPGLLSSAAQGTPPETLKALAVALRSEIRDRHYEFCDSPACAVYRGANTESPRVMAAVDATTGEVLVSSPPGAAFAADFHSVCGGETDYGVKDSTSVIADLTLRVFSAPPADLLCAPEDQTRWAQAKWSVLLDTSEISRRLGRDIGKFRGVEIIKRNQYGRALSAKFTGSKGEAAVDGADNISYALSAGTLRSPLYIIIPLEKGKKLLVRGIGTGNGGGLCIEGAKAMANSGADYKTILQKYFPGNVTIKE